jgi:hypothetical protein
MEQQQKDMENRLEIQRQEMELQIEMQMKAMTIHTERSVSSVINQVPQIVQGVLQGMGGYFNVTPLQLQAPSSFHPSLMLTGRVPTPQGSGTSSRPEPPMGMPTSSDQLENPLEGSPLNTSMTTSCEHSHSTHWNILSRCN